MIDSRFLDKEMPEGGESLRIYYEVLRKEPALVFIHGLATNHTVFNHYRTHFHEVGTGSLSYDSRGLGKSTLLASESLHTLDAHTGDLENLAEAEGIQRFTIIGLSAGTMVAQRYAALHPEQVESLVLISGSYNFKKSFERNFLRRAAFKLDPIRMLFTPYNCLMGLFYIDRKGHYQDFADKAFSKNHDIYFFHELYAKSSREYLESLHALGAAVGRWSTESIAAQIQAPTIIINGDSDPVIPKITAFELHELIPTSKEPIIIPNSGHSVIYKHPEEITRHIEDFLVGDIYSERLKMPSR